MKFVWCEPKTGLFFDSPPRERNTYRVIDSPAVRQTLHDLNGDIAGQVAFLERQEKAIKEVECGSDD